MPKPSRHMRFEDYSYNLNSLIVYYKFGLNLQNTRYFFVYVKPGMLFLVVRGWLNKYYNTSLPVRTLQN